MNPFLEKVFEKAGLPIRKRSVEYNGTTIEFHVRELSADTIFKMYEGVNEAKNDKDKLKESRKLQSAILARMVCDEKGEPMFTEEQANDPEFPRVLSDAIREQALRVNGLWKDEPEKVDATGKE